MEENPSRGDLLLYHDETLNLAYERWANLGRSFESDEEGDFDVSKVPDIYDNIKFDIQHNQSNLTLFKSKTALDLFEKAQLLAHVTVAQEYGMAFDEKVHIGEKICVNLVRKVLLDMVIASGVHEEQYVEAQKKHLELYRLNFSHSDNSHINSPMRHVRSRLYFTSESHIMSLFNLLRCRHRAVEPILSEETETNLLKDPELNYLSQIVIKVFEDKEYDFTDPRRFWVQLLYSSGARHDINDSEAYEDYEFRSDYSATRCPVVTEMIPLHEGFPLEHLLTFFEQFIPQSTSPNNATTSSTRSSTMQSPSGSVNPFMPLIAMPPASSMPPSTSPTPAP